MHVKRDWAWYRIGNSTLVLSCLGSKVITMCRRLYLATFLWPGSQERKIFSHRGKSSLLCTCSICALQLVCAVNFNWLVKNVCHRKSQRHAGMLERLAFGFQRQTNPAAWTDMWREKSKHLDPSFTRATRNFFFFLLCGDVLRCVGFVSITTGKDKGSSAQHLTWKRKGEMANSGRMSFNVHLIARNQVVIERKSSCKELGKRQFGTCLFILEWNFSLPCAMKWVDKTQWKTLITSWKYFLSRSVDLESSLIFGLWWNTNEGTETCLALSCC